MKKYSAYNLTIETEFPLPLPKGARGESPDISIHIGDPPAPKTLLKTDDGVYYAHGENTLFLKWEEVGTFLIEKGKKILLAPRADLEDKSLPSIPLLGTVMGVAMHQRGMTVIHGSSVLIDGRAVIFVGEKGQGKSTLAAYLRSRGHSLISDDICAIDFEIEQGKPYLRSSFPSMKLWPDAMKLVNITTEEHQKIHPAFEKRSILLNEKYITTPQEVAAVVILAGGAEAEITPLRGHMVVPAVLPHLIINRFPEYQPVDLHKTIYHQLTRLLQTVSVFRLARPRDLTLFSETAALVKSRV